MEIVMLQKLSMAAAAMMLTASVANAAVVQLQPIPDAFARLGVAAVVSSSRSWARASTLTAASPGTSLR